MAVLLVLQLLPNGNRRCIATSMIQQLHPVVMEAAMMRTRTDLKTGVAMECIMGGNDTCIWGLELSFLGLSLAHLSICMLGLSHCHIFAAGGSFHAWLVILGIVRVDLHHGECGMLIFFLSNYRYLLVGLFRCSLTPVLLSSRWCERQGRPSLPRTMCDLVCHCSRDFMRAAQCVLIDLIAQQPLRSVCG